ncbi:MAG: glycosyltransferase family 39 protein [Microgenomates group bacterium]
MKLRWIPTGIVIVVFAFFSIKTLPSYGVNWDSFQHLARGHIYLRYITQGKTDPPPVGSEERLSYYQKTPLTFEWAQQMTIGHPPVSDILMAATNRIVWGKFGLVGDIESHHLFVVLMTILTMIMLGVWSYLTFGPVASFFTVLAFGTLPHLFAEQHFNIKDPLILSYYTGALFFLWITVEYKKIWSVIISAVFFGLSLGTKFNIIFSLFPIVFWFISLKFWEDKKLRKIIILSLLIIPIVTYAIFVYTYPALWSSPLQKTIEVIKYYQGISGSSRECIFPPLSIYWVQQCSDWRTPLLFVMTMPLVTLLLFIFGAVFGWRNLARKNNVFLLWILWLLVTLGRATLPIMVLYGGSLRQIMEYMAPLTLLSGVGISVLYGSLTKRYFKRLLIVCVFFSYSFVIVKMIQIHPNENVYFNGLIGGLNGAIRYGLEGSDNTYGNAYKQGIRWINDHVESGATVSLGMGIRSAIPDTYLRSDINYMGDQSKIPEQQGEYIMELAYPGMNVNDYFRIRYALRFLDPVHVVMVDGVPLLYIWKNDKQHTNVDQTVETEVDMSAYQKKYVDDSIQFSFASTVVIKRVEFAYDNPACALRVQNAILNISGDRGRTWFNTWGIPGYFNYETPFYPGASDVYLFTGERITDLRIYNPEKSTCQWEDITVKIIEY